jgi:hypothetical protein
MLKQQIGQIISFNNTSYEILNQLYFQATGNSRKEYVVQQLRDIHTNEIEIRVAWILDGRWRQQTTMLSGVDYQRVNAVTTTW